MLKAQFFRPAHKKKIRPIILIVWVLLLGRIEKKFNKNVKKCKKNLLTLKQISKCETLFYIHFSRAFQNYII